MRPRPGGHSSGLPLSLPVIQPIPVVGPPAAGQPVQSSWTIIIYHPGRDWACAALLRTCLCEARDPRGPHGERRQACAPQTHPGIGPTHNAMRHPAGGWGQQPRAAVPSCLTRWRGWRCPWRAGCAWWWPQWPSGQGAGWLEISGCGTGLPSFENSVSRRWAPTRSMPGSGTALFLQPQVSYPPRIPQPAWCAVFFHSSDWTC